MAIPIGAARSSARSPTAFGASDVLVVAGVVYVVVALSTLLSRSVRDLGRVDIERRKLGEILDGTLGSAA